MEGEFIAALLDKTCGLAFVREEQKCFLTVSACINLPTTVFRRICFTHHTIHRGPVFSVCVLERLPGGVHSLNHALQVHYFPKLISAGRHTIKLKALSYKYHQK